jgi:hypothetical protein
MDPFECVSLYPIVDFMGGNVNLVRLVQSHMEQVDVDELPKGKKNRELRMDEKYKVLGGRKDEVVYPWSGKLTSLLPAHRSHTVMCLPNTASARREKTKAFIEVSEGMIHRGTNDGGGPDCEPNFYSGVV